MTLMELNLRPDQVRDLYLIHLQQMYSAEEQLLSEIPALAVSISSMEIRQVLLKEAVETPDHLTQLKKIFAELGETPDGSVCQPIKALVDFSMQLIFQHPFGSGRDLMLAGLALEMKHLNIAKYTMAATFARTLDLSVQDMLLSRVLREELEVERQLRFCVQNCRIGPVASELTLHSPQS